MSLKDTQVRDTPSYIIEPMLSVIFHCFEYKPMDLYLRGLIFECFFCQRIIWLIFEGAYNLGAYTRDFTVFSVKKKQKNRASMILLLVCSMREAKYPAYFGLCSMWEIAGSALDFICCSTLLISRPKFCRLAHRIARLS